VNVLPCVTVLADAVLVIVISASVGGRTLATSVAVSLAVFVSPPPDTTAVFVTVAGAVTATETVIVIGG
jgi:hypothetical protein